jgi:hypothetical protein
MYKFLSIIFCTLLCGLVAGCFPVFPNARLIDDLTKPAIIKLEAPSDLHKRIVSIHIRGSGAVVGTAQIELMLNGSPYRTEKLEGPISFDWRGDWYSPTAEIRYRPINAKDGKIALQYRFETL